MVAQLEEEFGLELVIRRARGVMLTEAGRHLYNHIQDSHAREALLQETINDLRGLKQGFVRIATGSGFVHGLVGTALPAFFASYPMIQVEIITATSEGILAAVLGDEAEIGIVFGPFDRRGVDVVHDIEEPLQIFVSPLHELAKKTSAISLRDVACFPLALPPVSSGIRQAVDAIWNEIGVRTKPTLTVGLVQGQIHFATSGLGATFLPAFCCSSEIQNSRLVSVDLEETFGLKTHAVIFIRSGRRASPATDVLLNQLKISFPFCS